MADAYDICVKANRIGFALGDVLKDDDLRIEYASGIAKLSDRGDMQNLTDLMLEIFDSSNADVIDVIKYLRDNKNSLEYRTNVGYSLAAGVRGPIKRPWR